jgi:DNA-binding MarR family transcriptional regulator
MKSKKSDARAVHLDELDQHVGYALRRAQLAVFEDFIAGQRGPVVRPGQFSVLAVIGCNPGITQSALCAALHIKRANLVGLIDHFETLGLARRQPSATDRRSNRLQLTNAGQRAWQSARNAQAKHEARIAKLLGAHERRALLDLLEKLGELKRR